MPEENITPEMKAEVARLSGAEKAAILMLNLGEDICSQVFTRLSDDQVMAISQEISKLGKIAPETSFALMAICHSELVGHAELHGTLDHAKRLLEAAFSPEIAREYIREIGAHGTSSIKGLSVLQRSDPAQLSKLLQSEHPQTVALVISHLDPPQGAKTIAQLDEEIRADVCQRLAQLDHISQPIRDRVISLIADKLDTGAKYATGTSEGGVRRVAEIFNRMERDISQACLETIEHDDPNMALAIRNNMFVFEDLLVVGDGEMRKIIQGVDKQVLVTALKGTNEELKEHFFRNMSTRAVDMLKEDMEALGPIRLKDAENAQQEIVNTVREMEAQGQIDLGHGGPEEYVS